MKATSVVYSYSALALGEDRVIALRDKVLAAVVQQLLGNASLAVRATKSLELVFRSRVEHAESLGNVANLLSAVPRGLAWSHVRWIVRTLEDAARRDAELDKDIGGTLHSAPMSEVRMGSPGKPFPEDVEQRDKAREVADGSPTGSPGERFYRSLQRAAEHAIERERERDVEWA